MSLLALPIALPALVLLLAGAVIADLRTRRIPNRLVLCGIAVALTAHLLVLSNTRAPLSATDIAAPLLGLVSAGAMLLPLYLLGACGAGDVKLMAMVGAFAGPQLAPWCALYTLIAGGVLSLVFMLRPGVARQTLANLTGVLLLWMQRRAAGGSLRLDPIEHSAARMPYALAIAGGSLVALLRAAPWST